jgi:hypothetical protein
MRILFSLMICVAMPALTQAQGNAEPWDVSRAAKDLSAQAERLKPLLDQLTPEQWQAKGAPAAYITQRRGAQDELGYMMRAAANLSRQPEMLTVALETYFRLQAVESQVTSLVEGVRRYQNPAVGDLIVSVMAANSANRDQLRQYITDLAQTREQEFQVADKEAQRCRGVLMRQPAARPPAAPKPATAPVTNAPAAAPAATPKDNQAPKGN